MGGLAQTDVSPCFWRGRSREPRPGPVTGTRFTGTFAPLGTVDAPFCSTLLGRSSPLDLPPPLLISTAPQEDVR